MEIKDFVKTSILQIIEGLEEATKELNTRQTRAVINPSLSHANHSNAKDVEFDIAVTATESKEGQAGAGIAIVGVKVGGQGNLKAENEKVSRIKFSVPVAWPSTAKDQYESSPPLRPNLGGF